MVIGGAGVAALEAAAALPCVAAGRVSVRLVAPDRMFCTRALRPLAASGIDSSCGVPTHALADRLDAELIADRMGWIDRDRYTVDGRRISLIAHLKPVAVRAHAPPGVGMNHRAVRTRPGCPAMCHEGNGTGGPLRRQWPR